MYFVGGGYICSLKQIFMKKYILMLSCLAMLLLCGCSKDNSKGGETADPVTWASLVADHPFLSAFPEFRGEIENVQYRDLGGLETVTFFDYNCSESVATTYYSSVASAGFTKSEGSEIYRKKGDKVTYAFSGGYSGGNFALSFSADNN